MEISKNYENQRVVILSDDTQYNYGLYLKSWGILGYSQYNPSSRGEIMKDLGFDCTYEEYNSKIKLNRLSLLGVSKVLDGQGNIIKDFGTPTSIRSFNGALVNEYSLEGNYYFKVYSDSNQRFNTYVNNHPGWVIRVNGSKIPNISPNTVFLEFDIPAGEVDIEISYVPKIFYLSILGSLVGLISSYFLIKKIYYSNFS
jgi:hypothetical protein